MSFKPAPVHRRFWPDRCFEERPMSRPISPLVSLVLTAALVSQGCSGRLSDNNRRGIILAGGATVFMGMIIAGDGLSCDDTFGGANGTEDCAEDKADLVTGGLMIGAGLVVGAIGYLLKPKVADTATPAAAAPVAKKKTETE
jgi:hypothetical protein